MTSKQVMAVAALLPSLGLLVQQTLSALGGAQAQPSATPAADPAAVPPGLEGPSR
ncbi:hypothetical protein ACH4D5_05830 [Streptomyces sp. NPDC018029]|uniref:hypothetical protein n=1 Tax=Streptomyces sp. NPDC018029 TaxID=3365032 RepID=UPI003795D74B